MMSLKRLMVIVSVAGVTSTSAVAQTLAFGATTPAPARAGVNDRIASGTNVVSGPVMLDSNARLGIAPDPATGTPPAITTNTHNAQDFELRISGLTSLNPPLRNTNVFFVQGVLTGAVFAVDAAGADGGIVDLDTADTANAGYSGNFVTLQRTADDETTDGNTGDTSFRIMVTLTGPTDATAPALSSIGVNLPIRFNGCPRQADGASVQIEILGAGDNNAPGASLYDSGSFNLIECFDPLAIAVASDVQTGNSQLALGDRMRFNPGVPGPPSLNPNGDVIVIAANPDSATQATVGVITLTRTAPPDNAALLTSLGMNTDTNEMLDNSGDYSGISAQLALSGAATTADLRQVRASFGTPGATPPPLESFAYTGTATSGAAASATIDYPVNTLQNVVFSSVPFSNGIVIDLANVASAEETLLSTAVVVSDVTVSYANGRDSKAILTGDTDSVALDALDPQVATCGEFDRIGDNAQPYGTEIRVTGLAGTTSIIAHMRNPTGTGVSPGTATLTDADLTGTSTIVTQEHFTTAFGNFGDADFVLGFDGVTTPANLDCDRLLTFVNRTNLLAPFGNDRIQVANPVNNDGDD